MTRKFTIHAEITIKGSDDEDVENRFHDEVSDKLEEMFDSWEIDDREDGP